MNFTENHLDLMLAHRNSVKKIYQLSATKQKLAYELMQVGVMKSDDEGFVHNSEIGDTVLDLTVREFDRIIPRKPT